MTPLYFRINRKEKNLSQSVQYKRNRDCLNSDLQKVSRKFCLIDLTWALCKNVIQEFYTAEIQQSEANNSVFAN